MFLFYHRRLFFSIVRFLRTCAFSGKPSLSARNRNVLTRESSRPEVDPRQVCGRDSGNIFSIPLILLYIVYGTVAAVCEFVYFTMAFTYHSAKLKAFAETAHTAEKIQKGYRFIQSSSSFLCRRLICNRHIIVTPAQPPSKVPMMKKSNSYIAEFSFQHKNIALLFGKGSDRVAGFQGFSLTNAFVVSQRRCLLVHRMAFVPSAEHFATD